MRDLVRYLGATTEQVQWGSNDDPRDVLTVGQVYEVAAREVHTWHTKLTLVGWAGRFNSASFATVSEVEGMSLICQRCGHPETFHDSGTCHQCGCTTFTYPIHVTAAGSGGVMAEKGDGECGGHHRERFWSPSFQAWMNVVRCWRCLPETEASWWPK